MAVASVAIGPRAVLGESPLWDSRTGELYWIDIESHLVHRWQASTGSLSMHPLPGRPGFVALTDAEGTLLIGVESRVGFLDWATGGLTWRLRLPLRGPQTRLNDGKVDPQGSLWVGSMHVPASDSVFMGSLFRVGLDWEVTEVLSGVGVANGIAFSPSSAHMYFADSALRRVWCVPESRNHRDFRDEAPYVDFDDLALPGRPDGACVDAEGCYWLACVYGSAVICIGPAGTLERVIEVPVSRPTSVAFGGPNLETLFVTTIGGGGHYPRIAAETESGRVLAMSVGARGIHEAHRPV